MRIPFPRQRDWLLIAVAVTISTAAVVGVTSEPSPTLERAGPGPAAAAALPPTAAPTMPPAPVVPRVGVAVTLGSAYVRVVPTPGAEVMSVLRRGIVLPVRATSNGFVRIETPCELDGWVARSDVTFLPHAAARATTLREATIVIDPGHGGLDTGAVGPTGLEEKTVNLDIARRLETLLRPARVVLTHDTDFTAGLQYRTDIATSLGAQLFLSVHNNSSPEIRTDVPGTETYYQLRSPASKRLAGLTYEEIVRALERFSVAWVSQPDAGAKYRLNERGTDYYHVLRTTVPPAVIVEGMYISNPPEEALLRRDDVRELMAAALARAVDRFVTTSDPGSGFVTPRSRGSGPVYVTPSACRDPA
jgi:N-acetylmuramoyl-L-alanine amidase